MTKLKKLIMPLIFIITALFLVACDGGSFTTIGSVEKSKENSMEMTYHKFKGHKYTTVDLKNGDEITLNIEVETKEGKLEVTFKDNDKKDLIKEENPKEKITKTIKIEKDGTYEIRVEGNHKGSFKVNWDVKKK